MRTENYHLAHALEAQWGGGAGVSGYQRVRTDGAEFLSPVSPPALPALRRWSARSRLFLVLQWEKSRFAQALRAQYGGGAGVSGCPGVRTDEYDLLSPVWSPALLALRCCGVGKFFLLCYN